MADCNNKDKALREAQSLCELVDNQMILALEILERQMNVLHTRSQVLVSLAGIVVTVTGFSGRLIAGTSILAKITIVLGLSVVLLSAVWVWSRVMAVKWITSDLDGESVKILANIITRRNARTSAYKTGGAMLCAGLFIYGLAIAQMLLFSV